MHTTENHTLTEVKACHGLFSLPFNTTCMADNISDRVAKINSRDGPNSHRKPLVCWCWSE